MSDETPVEEKKGGVSASGVIGTLAGAAGLGHVVDRQYAKKFVKSVNDPEALKKATDAIANEADATKKTALEQALEKKTDAFDKVIRTDKAKGILAKESEQRTASGRAFEFLENEANHENIAEIVFEKADKAHTATVKLMPEALAKYPDEASAKAAGLVDTKFEHGKLTEGSLKMHTLEALPEGVVLKDGKAAITTAEEFGKLTTVAPGAAAEAKSWLATATENLAKETRAINAKAFVKSGGIKGSGIGSGLMHTGNLGKAAIIGSVVVGGFVGGKVLHAIFGGKHTNKVEAGRTDPQLEAQPAR